MGCEVYMEWGWTLALNVLQPGCGFPLLMKSFDEAKKEEKEVAVSTTTVRVPSCGLPSPNWFLPSSALASASLVKRQSSPVVSPEIG